MSFDNKCYPNRKDHRKPYQKGSGESVDKSCRSHGGDPYSESNKLHDIIKNAMIAKHELANFESDGDPSEGRLS